MDWPTNRMPPPAILTPWSPECVGGPADVGILATVSATWPVTDLALIYPFVLTDWGLAQQLLFYVGATANGNIDVGIYDSQGNLIISAGNTAMGSTNTVQALNITDTWLPPGRYFLAAKNSNTTGTVFRANAVDEQMLSRFPLYEMALGAGAALPQTLTPVLTTQASGYMVAIGIQFVATF